MTTCAPGDRVTDGDRCGVVAYVIQGDRRGMEGGSLSEAFVRWDSGEGSFECIADLFAEGEDDDTRHRW